MPNAVVLANVALVPVNAPLNFPVPVTSNLKLPLGAPPIPILREESENTP
jgi:hypothetical protein